MLKRYKVKGHSMHPTFVEGDRILVHSFFRTIKVGDTVVFKHKNLNLIKRVKSVIWDGEYVLGSDHPLHKKHYIAKRKDIKGKVLLKY